MSKIPIPLIKSRQIMLCNIKLKIYSIGMREKCFTFDELFNTICDMKIERQINKERIQASSRMLFFFIKDLN